MSYQVLARKWRPKSFATLVGQEHVKNTLINALQMGRLHHAYLFSGTRGVGKTTIARIFAKSLNCDLGVTDNPCGQCDACMTIDKGQFIDLIEIDAASRTKVEDTREILNNVQYAPTRGRFKVYLIDEVHMLSKSSFNALLKTLEEPPSHVKFLLATTDPQKLPITILSRCLQFNLRALLRSEIVGHLQYILGEENIGYDEESLRLLAKSADGSLRDALSLTDQAIAQSNGALQCALVQQMLGTLDKQWSVKLLAHIVNQDPEKALNTVNDIAQFTPDYVQLLDQLLSIFHLAAMCQLVPSVAQIEENLHAFITRLAQKLSPQDIQLYYQILLNGKKDIDLAPDPRMGFEMVLLRLMAFQPLNTIERPEAGDAISIPTLQPEAAPSAAPVEPMPLIAKKNTEIRASQPNESILAVTPAPDDLNAQQNSLVFAAQQQGFKPAQPAKTADVAVAQVIESTAQSQFQPVQTVEQVIKAAPVASAAPVPVAHVEPAPVANTAIVPPPVPQEQQNSEYQGFPVSEEQSMPDISFSNDDDDSGGYGDMAFDQAAYLEMDMATNPADFGQTTPPLVSIKPVANPQDSNYEDPVAAILANRNLVMNDNFGGPSEPKPPVKPAKPDVETPKRVEKPIAQQSDTVPVAQALNDLIPQTHKPQTESFELAAVETPTKAPLAQTQSTNLSESKPQHLEPDALAVESLSASEPEPVVEQSKPIEIPSATANLSGIPRWAGDVDEWAAMIEKMQLGGLVRLLAVKSVYKLQDKIVVLKVSDTEMHLDSSGLRDQLTKSMIRVLNQVIELELEFGPEDSQTPFNIQRRIEADRLVYAKQQIYQDPLIVALQQQFAANVDESSIAAVG